MLRTIQFITNHPIAGHARSRNILRYVGWQIRSRLVGGEVIVPWVKGTKLAVRAGMRGATGNIYCGLDEYVEMGFLLHFLRPNDLFCDIGANIGSYSILASGVAGAETYAFEPDPRTAGSFLRNVEINGLTERVALHQVALGAKEGVAPFSVGRGSTNRVFREDEDVIEHQFVPMRTLDSVLAGRVPSFLKIDVEGYEKNVFDGAEATLSSKKLLAISTENYDPVIEEFLARFGYRRFFYDPASREVSDYDLGIRSVNTLVTRDHALVRERVSNADAVTVLGVTL